MKILITLDYWLSANLKVFIYITGYFITKDFHFCEVLLSFSPLYRSHTGDNLAEVLVKILNKYGLIGHILSMIIDNVSIQLQFVFFFFFNIDIHIQVCNNSTMYVNAAGWMIAVDDPDASHAL